MRNRLPHAVLKHSPFEKLTGEKPTLKHIRIFGCTAFVYEHHPKSKVHARATPEIFLGCTDHGVYLIERTTDRKIIESVHVTFDEENFPGLDNDSSSSSGEEDDIYDQADSSESSSATGSEGLSD